MWHACAFCSQMWMEILWFNPRNYPFLAGGALIHRAFAIANCASFQFYSRKKIASPIFCSKQLTQLPLPPSVNFRQINWINCDDQRVHRRHHGLHHCARQRIVLQHSPSTGMKKRLEAGGIFMGSDNQTWHGEIPKRNRGFTWFYMVLLGTRLDYLDSIKD